MVSSLTWQVELGCREISPQNVNQTSLNVRLLKLLKLLRAISAQFLIASRLISLNLFVCKASKVCSLMKCTVPGDDPVKCGLQRQNRMPIQADSGLGCIQLKQVRFVGADRPVLRP